MSRFPKYLNDALIGILLSDGTLERSSDTSSVRLSINMSMKNCPYAFHLYNLFEPYIDTNLKMSEILNKSISIKYYSIVRFKTICMPLLLLYYNLFYKKKRINNRIIKIVPENIESQFNEISLAHLIMGDGNYLNERNIIRIYTNSFTRMDVLLLSNTINKNLCINNKVVHDRNDQYLIIIEKNNVNITREVVLPYIHPSMKYKLGLKEKESPLENFDYFSIIKDI